MHYLEGPGVWDTFRDVHDDVFSLEYANESEARHARLAAQRAGDGQGPRTAARRTLAQGLAAVSRGSAAAARRLDAGAAEHLGRGLAPTR